MATVTTITELQERLDECEKLAQDYSSSYVFAYEAEAQYLDNLLSELDEDVEECGYDEDDWRYWLESLLEDHISDIYDDWYQSEENIYPDSEGNWSEGTCGYQWMVWALETEIYGFTQRMVEYAEESDKELPQWYKDECEE